MSTLITLSGPALVRYAVDAGIKKHDTHPLNVAALIFLALAVLKPFVVRTQILLAATAGERFLHALRIAAFDKLQALPLGFFERERAGVLVSRLTSDVQSLNELVRDALVEIAGSALQIVLTMAALLFLSPRLAVISLVALPILVASSWSFHHGAGRAYHAIRDRVAETLTALSRMGEAALGQGCALLRELGGAGLTEEVLGHLRSGPAGLIPAVQRVREVLGLNAHRAGDYVNWLRRQSGQAT